MAIVWLASYPRSGVTYLRHVLERVYGVRTFTMYPEPTHLTHMFDGTRMYDFNGESTQSVDFVKTHTLDMAATPLPAIHLIRDPFDTMVSYAHYLRDIRHDERDVATLVRDIVGGMAELGMWGTHLLAWFARPAVRMTFSELTSAPIRTVINAVTALQLPLEPNCRAELDEFTTMQARKPEFFRSGKSGVGQHDMPADALKGFHTLQGGAYQAYCSFVENHYGDDTLQRTSTDSSAVH